MMNNMYCTLPLRRAVAGLRKTMGRKRRVTVGKENPLIQEGSLFLGPEWDQVVVQDHLTVY